MMDWGEANTTAVIAMSRTGHTAIREWIRQQTGSLPHNVEARSLEDSMDAIKNTGACPILVVRDFPNWLASMVSFFAGATHENRPEFWAEHIDRYHTHLMAARAMPTICYPHWVRAGLGEGIHGAESKFEDKLFLNRWMQMQDNPTFKHYFAANPGLVAQSKQVMGC